GKGVRATIDGKRTASRDFGLQTRARLGAGGVQLETVRLVVDQTEFTGAGRIGRGVELTLSGHGPVDALTAFVPSLAGKGTLDLQDVKVHLREDDTVRLSGRVAVEELSLADAQVVRPRLRFQVDARVDGPNLRDLETDLLLTAVEAAYDTVHVTGLVVREQGRGDLVREGEGEGYRVNASVKQQKLRIDTVKWEQVELQLAGKLAHALQDRREVDLAGDISFARWQLGPLPLTDATGKVRVRRDVVEIPSFQATCSEGSVRGKGKLFPRGTDVAWEIEAVARDIKLSEEMGDPLSFLVPILRVRRGHEASRLSGRLHADFALRADGTTNKLLEQTRGQGRVDFDDIEVRNSIILPLLGFRIDKLLLNKPYRFKDLKVGFKLGDGILKPERFKLRGHPFNIEIWGEARLAGTIDFVIAATLIPPVRVRGPIDSPKARTAIGARFRKDK
ncbi:MAG: AsmA family protein, partial [Planctomycetota bacterium]